MTTGGVITALLIIVGWVAAVWAIRLPESAWTAADKNRTFWVVGLLIPYVNVLLLVGFVFAALPALLAANNGSGVGTDEQFRRRRS